MAPPKASASSSRSFPATPAARALTSIANANNGTASAIPASDTTSLVVMLFMNSLPCLNRRFMRNTVCFATFLLTSSVPQGTSGPKLNEYRLFLLLSALHLSPRVVKPVEWISSSKPIARSLDASSNAFFDCSHRLTSLITFSTTGNFSSSKRKAFEISLECLPRSLG